MIVRLLSLLPVSPHLVDGLNTIISQAAEQSWPPGYVELV